jgi:hypothetical protein
VHAVTFTHDGHRISLDVRVRHVRTGRSVGGTIVYLAGVEFLSTPAAFPELVADIS